MEERDCESEKMAKEAMDQFFSNFGKLDIHAQIVLEEFFRLIKNEAE